MNKNQHQYCLKNLTFVTDYAARSNVSTAAEASEKQTN
jgi:hypothetical protein